MTISKKASSVNPSSTLVMDSKAKSMKAKGIDVISFSAGEPDFDTPKHIKEAAINAINNSYTKYTPASGMLELKEAVCRELKNDYGVEYNPNQIVVSNGAKHSLINIFTAICEPGDEVIIPTPYWVSYPEMIKLADGIPVFVDTKEENGFKLSIDNLKNAVNNKTRAIIINSPSNPTGMIYSKQDLEQIAKIAIENNIYIISDEIYGKLIYDDNTHVSIASLGDEIKNLTIIVNGVSKAYAMTGWRIGYTASNNEIANAMANIQSHATSNPNSIAQVASIEALDGPQDDVYKMKAAFEERRNYMYEKINNINGLSCLKPQGAFYVFVNIKKILGKTFCGKTINSSEEFANVLLDEVNVVLVPGSGFGADEYVRLSYAISMENIKEGLNRIEKFLSNNV